MRSSMFPPTAQTMRLFALALGLLAASTVLAGDSRNQSRVFGSLTAEAGSVYGDLEAVNGGIQIERGARVRSAETVNGGILIAEGAEVGRAETVNGGIRIAGRVRLGSAETVNGGIVLETGSHASGKLRTVNGSIRVGQGSTVEGEVATINGGIRLAGAEVRGLLRTVNGDIHLERGSRAGGIEIDSANRGWWNWGSEKLPKVVVGPDAVVAGPMVFKREVRLYVHASARIGEVRGATPLPFEGEQAPE